MNRRRASAERRWSERHRECRARSSRERRAHAAHVHGEVIAVNTVFCDRESGEISVADISNREREWSVAAEKYRTEIFAITIDDVCSHRLLNYNFRRGQTGERSYHLVEGRRIVVLAGARA